MILSKSVVCDEKRTNRQCPSSWDRGPPSASVSLRRPWWCAGWLFEWPKLPQVVWVTQVHWQPLQTDHTTSTCETGEYRFPPPQFWGQVGKVFAENAECVRKWHAVDPGELHMTTVRKLLPWVTWTLERPEPLSCSVGLSTNQICHEICNENSLIFNKSKIYFSSKKGFLNNRLHTKLIILQISQCLREISHPVISYPDIVIFFRSTFVFS